MKNKITLDGFMHGTPVLWNWISIFLIGYATYQPMVMEWVHSAPFGTDIGKELVMDWLDWICPFAGLIIQFAHKNNSSNPEDGQDK
jgi:hypothetical protein